VRGDVTKRVEITPEKKQQQQQQHHNYDSIYPMHPLCPLGAREQRQTTTSTTTSTPAMLRVAFASPLRVAMCSYGTVMVSLFVAAGIAVVANQPHVVCRQPTDVWVLLMLRVVTIAILLFGSFDLLFRSHIVIGSPREPLVVRKRLRLALCGTGAALVAIESWAMALLPLSGTLVAWPLLLVLGYAAHWRRSSPPTYSPAPQQVPLDVVTSAAQYAASPQRGGLPPIHPHTRTVGL
jgi:hypothetical protein